MIINRRGPLVLTEERHVRRLSLTDFPQPPGRRAG